MYSQIKAYLSRFIHLTEEEFEAFAGKLVAKKLKKKEVYFLEGEISRQVAFINKGCLRYYYLVNGEEHTGQFFFENSFYTDYESFLSGQPSRQNIDALEKTELLLLSRTDLYQFYETNPKFERFGRLMAENAYLGLRKRNNELLNLNPEERYVQLLRERPKVMERIPQHYIASYLGIKPESLSRIRKRIARQNAD
jgi:CRP/FNR family transcriptional regulator, anaerobic regulatory protein